MRRSLMRPVLSLQHGRTGAASCSRNQSGSGSGSTNSSSAACSMTTSAVSPPGGHPLASTPLPERFQRELLRAQRKRGGGVAAGGAHDALLASTELSGTIIASPAPPGPVLIPKSVSAAVAMAASLPPPGPLPTLNLGYAADNVTLRRAQRVTTSRNCIRRTFDERGLAHVSRLALQNCLDLVTVLAWNQAQGIRLFRVSSMLFPWAGEYALEELPDFEAIVAALAAAGRVARAGGQRLTSHPPHFVKLASLDAELVRRSLADLELHARIFDLMGFPPTHWNKINIHVGGVYGSKTKSMARFAASVASLSPSCRARLTVENDDRRNSYSVADLLQLHADSGVPITFDFHHHKFCPGGQSLEQALQAALDTWPAGVRPVVHWSEPPECPQRAKLRPHAHSAFVYGPIDVLGREGEVDVMIESKAKEVALLLYRDELAPRLAARAAAAQAAASGQQGDSAVRLVLPQAQQYAGA